MSVTGRQATLTPLNKEKYGTNCLNDGVQRGSPIFTYTFQLISLSLEIKPPIFLAQFWNDLSTIQYEAMGL
jgi:hypothetical protein